MQPHVPFGDVLDEFKQIQEELAEIEADEISQYQQEKTSLDRVGSDSRPNFLAYRNVE